MINDKMVSALNEQINAELYSAYLYLAMSAWASGAGLNGTANWLRVQYQEETAHALRIYDYVNSVDGRVELKAIDSPPAEFESVKAVYEAVLEHERKVTGLINELVNLAVEEKDHATRIFLQWFVSEQVEEEESANDILSQLKLAGGDGGGLFMIDKDLATRVFTPPAAATT